MAAPFAPAKRATLWIPDTGPANDTNRGHLFVILTDPCKEGHNLLVPICSAYERCDRACLVGVGDHPFLKHPSFVFYGGMRTFESAGLVEAERKGRATYRGAVDDRLFGFICAGVAKSPFAPLKFKKYFEAQLAAEKAAKAAAAAKKKEGLAR